MKKTTKMVVMILFVSLILLGIGYAAIQNITLKVTGKAIATPDQSNFIVMFEGEPIVSDENYVAAAITGDLDATININELKEKNKPVTATYTIKNESDDLSANISIITEYSNQEYFFITSELEKRSLKAGESTTLVVTAELMKLLVKEDNTSSKINIQLKAMPVQPGEEWEKY